MQPVASYAARLMLVNRPCALTDAGVCVCVCVWGGGGGGGGLQSVPDCPPPQMSGGYSVTALRSPGLPTTLYSAVLPLSSLDDSRAFGKRPLKSSSTQPQTVPGLRRTAALMPAQEVMVARLRLFPLTIVAILTSVFYPAAVDLTNPGHASLPVVLLA